MVESGRISALKRGEHKVELGGSMIAFNPSCNHAAMTYSAVKSFCTRKDIYHCLIAVFHVGEGGMFGCVKEGVFNPELVRKVEGEEVGAACVASGRTMWPKHHLEFFTVSMANFGIDISANDELGFFWDKVQ